MKCQKEKQNYLILNIHLKNYYKFDGEKDLSSTYEGLVSIYPTGRCMHRYVCVSILYQNVQLF